MGGNILPTDAEMALVSKNLLAEIQKQPGLRQMGDEFGGRVFQFSDAQLYKLPEARQILEHGGYVFEQRMYKSGQIYYQAFLPDPVRLLACCRANDVPIKFINDTDPVNEDIPDFVIRRVLESDKSHPVGVAGFYYYTHDLNGTDHFMTLVVGGRRLINWIVQNNPAGSNLADVYDHATYYIQTALFALFANDDPSSQIREVTNIFRPDTHPAKYNIRRPMDEDDQRRANELRSILYEGLQRLGIHRPELISPPTTRWQRLGRRLLGPTSDQ